MAVLFLERRRARRFMHIPDGYLGPQTYIPFYGICIAFWSVALKKIKKALSARHVPYLAMAAAFSFLIMMFNIPIPGGTTGHAVGGGIIAILLGPWTAVIAVSVSLIIQALIFGDGGITAIGANCFNMAVVMPFVSYWVFTIARGKAAGGKRLTIAAFLSGYVGLSAAAAATGIEFGIQPLIAHGPDGRPLYAPYPLSVALPAMLLEHMVVFSVVEGIVTVLLLRYFLKHEPDLVYALRKRAA
jgi:cobalt/nickel transport system permease protein